METATKRVVTHDRRAARRQRAIERIEARAKRSNEEQIALIAGRPGGSKRELARLRGERVPKRHENEVDEVDVSTDFYINQHAFYSFLWWVGWMNKLELVP